MTAVTAMLLPVEDQSTREIDLDDGPLVLDENRNVVGHVNRVWQEGGWIRVEMEIDDLP